MLRFAPNTYNIKIWSNHFAIFGICWIRRGNMLFAKLLPHSIFIFMKLFFSSSSSACSSVITSNELSLLACLNLSHVEDGIEDIYFMPQNEGWNCWRKEGMYTKLQGCKAWFVILREILIRSSFDDYIRVLWILSADTLMWGILRRSFR